MSTGLKILVGLATAFAVLLIGSTMLLGTVVAVGGVASFRMASSDGPNLYVPVPAALIDVAATSGGWMVSGSRHGDLLLEELEHEVDLDRWGGVARNLLEVIEDCPDVTFVEVVDGNDTVRVFKEGRYLRVRVTDGRDLDLEVSVPTKTATRTVARLLGA